MKKYRFRIVVYIILAVLTVVGIYLWTRHNGNGHRYKAGNLKNAEMKADRYSVPANNI